MIKSILTVALLGLGGIMAPAGKITVPSELESQLFADAKMAPSPAVICASPYGDVYVGVDMQGSLGKKPNLGYVVKLVDTDQDGKADKRTVFTKVDNPRGLISIGDRLFVLHCTQKDGKIHTQQLSVYTDTDRDGVADGPGQALVTDIGNPKFLKSRGTDHSTNNIRLGIDGWIYISVGDFGFIGAEGKDGKKLSMHGGGIVRVRPDGSELETFIHGTRNVYDVAIDPFMNMFTRENTNDGVGWWIRFSHYIQSGEYGYPSLYTNFPEDMLPALGEYGGGSGTGNLYFQEPGWPAKYNNTAMMADWGLSKIFIHRLTKDGASFRDKPEDFIDASQVTDIDVDGSGRMYVSAWNGAGYKGSAAKGFVSVVTPKGWRYKEFPNLMKMSPRALVALLKTKSSTARVYAQQEILRRNVMSLARPVLAVATNKSVAIEGRVAAVYTYAQLAGEKALGALRILARDPAIREHCVRAMADRLKFAKKVDLNLLKAALRDSNPRVQVAAAVALGRSGNVRAANALLAKATPPSAIKPGESGKLHSTPHSKAVLPHVAVQALLSLKAEGACIAALQSKNVAMQRAALSAMKFMHSEKVVHALIEAQATNKKLNKLIVSTLARLHQKEKDYDGSTWWSTRPDPAGPYFTATDWAGTQKVTQFFLKYYDSLRSDQKGLLLAELKKNKADILGLVKRKKVVEKGATVGKTSIEDIVLYVADNKGVASRGSKIIGKVGCAGCHNTKAGEVVKGPDLTKLGGMTPSELAEAIIKPGATIAPSWVSITMNDGAAHMGTIVKKDTREIILHNIAGIPTKLDATKVKSIAPGLNMMSLHLCDALTLKEFTDLLAYIKSLDKSKKK